MTGRRWLTILFFACAAVAVLALVRIAWSWDDWPAFAAHPARAALLVIMAGVFAAPIAYLPPNALNPGRLDSHVRRQMVMPALAGLAMVGVLVSGAWCDRRDVLVLPADPFWRAAGVGLSALGAWFSAWGPFHLGRQFSIFATIQEDHDLVTDGPFAIVRHPRYFGFMTWAVGSALVFRSSVALAFAAAITGLLVWRIVDEERVLRREFGSEWERYRRRTPLLIPGLI